MTHERFPYRDHFEVDGATYSAAEIIEGLTPHISDTRRESIARVVDHRTYSIVTVLDGLYDTGNVAAVMRSAEGFGFAEVHVLEMIGKYKFSKRITGGAHKWLDVHRHRSRPPCVENLKSRGYRIVATHLDDSAQPIHEFDFAIPTAIVFGNERDGVSDELLAMSDARMIVPMLGFVQSFNISVAAAVTLAHVVEARRRELGGHGDLDADQRHILTAEYYLRSLSKPAPLLKRWRLG